MDVPPRTRIARWLPDAAGTVARTCHRDIHGRCGRGRNIPGDEAGLGTLFNGRKRQTMRPNENRGSCRAAPNSVSNLFSALRSPQFKTHSDPNTLRGPFAIKFLTAHIARRVGNRRAPKPLRPLSPVPVPIPHQQPAKSNHQSTHQPPKPATQHSSLNPLRALRVSVVKHFCRGQK